MRRIISGAVGALGASALLGAMAIAPPQALAASNHTSAQDCEYPSEVLDLERWKIQLPTGEDGDVDEVTQPDLDRYAVDPWFTPLDDCSGVQFRASVDGVTTGGSEYPRSELREMTEDGSDETEWSADEGTHTMVIEQAITDLPNDKPHLVAGQIHGGDDDVSVFRLEDSKLYVTEGDDEKHLIKDDYELGTPFEAKFVVSDGEIEAYLDGELVTTLPADFDSGYFKAGAYTQANCDSRSDPCSEDNYGQVEIYDVQVTHE